MVKRNFLRALIGNGINSICSWAMLAVIAKLGTAQMMGQFALSLAVAQPIFVLTSFNLGGVLMTDTRREFRFLDYFSIRMFMSGLGFVALLLVCGLGRFAAQTRWVILLNGVGIAIDGFSQLLYGLLALHGRMDRVAVSLSAKGLLSLAGVIAGLAYAHSIVWAAGGSALASALVVLCYDLESGRQVLRPVGAADCAGDRKSRRELRKEAARRFVSHWNTSNWGTLHRLAALAAPMGVTVTLITLTTSIPRLFLESRFGAGNLGLFAAQASFVTIGRMAGNSLDQASRPLLACHFAAGDRVAFVRLLSRLLRIGVLATSVVLALAAGCGRPVLRILFTREYAHSLDVLLICLAAGGLGFLGNTYLNAMSAARQFRVQVVCMALTVAAALLASAILIPALGLRGAALASLAPMVVQVAVGALIVKKIVAAMCAGHGTA